MREDHHSFSDGGRVVPGPDTEVLAGTLGRTAVHGRLDQADDGTLDGGGDEHFAPPALGVGGFGRFVFSGGQLPDLLENRRGQDPAEHADEQAQRLEQQFGHRPVSLCRLTGVSCSRLVTWSRVRSAAATRSFSGSSSLRVSRSSAKGSRSSGTPLRMARSRWVSALNSAPSRIAMFEIHSQTRKTITVASEP